MVAGDRPATLQPQEDFPTNRGGLCSKGWTAADLLDHPERLLTPLVRDRPRRPDQPAAAGVLGRGARPGRRRHHAAPSSGTAATASACFGGGGLTNEKAYALGKFARVALRTATIDYNGRFCMSSAATAGNRAFGIDRGLPFPLADIAEADAILLVGANPADTMPPAMQYFDEGRAARRPAHRGRPAAHRHRRRRRTCTSQPLPGTDLALANGLLHIAIRRGPGRRGVHRRAHDRLRRRSGPAVASYWPDRVERITGVARRRSCGRPCAPWPRRRRAMILTARGAEQHSNGTDTAQAFINLALALGLPGQAGRPATAPSPARATARAAASTARRPTSCPATAGSTTRPPARTSPRSGASTRTSSRCPGSRRSRCSTGWAPTAACGRCWCWPPTSWSPRPTPTGSATGSRALDLLVVSDIFLSETAALADVVLPTAQWAEEDGTMTNLEGRVIRRRRRCRRRPACSTTCRC